MATRYGRICGPGDKKKTRGSRFLKITRSGVVYDVTKEFTGHAAKSDRKKPRKKAAPKRKSKSNFGRKRSGPIKGFASRKQKAAALKNVKKAQRARR